MKSRDFCYWLQGFFELMEANEDFTFRDGIRYEQVQVIRNHLNLVFAHEIDKQYEGNEVETQTIHDGQQADGYMFREETRIKC